jgi:hypothetical protein
MSAGDDRAQRERRTEDDLQSDHHGHRAAIAKSRTRKPPGELHALCRIDDRYPFAERRDTSCDTLRHALRPFAGTERVLGLGARHALPRALRNPLPRAGRPPHEPYGAERKQDDKRDVFPQVHIVHRDVSRLEILRISDRPMVSSTAARISILWPACVRNSSSM